MFFITGSPSIQLRTKLETEENLTKSSAFFGDENKFS